ncbi:uncharacterized protein LOC113066983 [Carassius auratus]|uniref:Uncharacterized protein LOC113066983 n=1 Tax=Carassius auratus TaxID=7957 RepID=A0A6P6MG54_CARAU|nr:uncharacterized protein LOC113066983 [Carassius auratus]
MEMQYLTVVFSLFVCCELSVVLALSNNTTYFTSKNASSYKVREINTDGHERRVTLNKISYGTGKKPKDVLSSTRTTINLTSVNRSYKTTVGAFSRQKDEITYQMDRNRKTKSFLRKMKGEIRVNRRFRRQERVTARNDPDSTCTSGRRRPNIETSASIPKTSIKHRPGGGRYHLVSALFSSSSVVGPELVHDRGPMPRFSVCACPVFVSFSHPEREKRIIPATSVALRLPEIIR